MLTWIKASVSKQMLRRWLRTNTTFVFSCRISTRCASHDQRYVATIVVTRTNFGVAEESAQSFVTQWVQQHCRDNDNELEIKWRKARALTDKSLEFENEGTIRLLDSMRRQRCNEKSLVEPVAAQVGQ